MYEVGHAPIVRETFHNFKRQNLSERAPGALVHMGEGRRLLYIVKAVRLKIAWFELYSLVVKRVSEL